MKRRDLLKAFGIGLLAMPLASIVQAQSPYHVKYRISGLKEHAPGPPSEPKLQLKTAGLTDLVAKTAFVPNRAWSTDRWSDGGGDAFDGFGLFKVAVRGGAWFALPVNGNSGLDTTTTVDGLTLSVRSRWVNPYTFVVEVKGDDETPFQVRHGGNLGSDSNTRAVGTSTWGNIEGQDFYYSAVITNDGSINATGGDPQVWNSIIAMDPGLGGRAYKHTLSGDRLDLISTESAKGFTSIVGWGEVDSSKAVGWMRDNFELRSD